MFIIKSILKTIGMGWGFYHKYNLVLRKSGKFLGLEIVLKKIDED